MGSVLGHRGAGLDVPISGKLQQISLNLLTPDSLTLIGKLSCLVKKEREYKQAKAAWEAAVPILRGCSGERGTEVGKKILKFLQWGEREE